MKSASVSRTRSRPTPARPDSWQETPDLLVAVIPLVLTVLLLISGFTPILKTLSDPNTTWTGFQYQGLINRLVAFTLAELSPSTSALQRNHLRLQVWSSLDNTAEFTALTAVERIGPARLGTVRTLFTAALNTPQPAQRRARLQATIEEAQWLNAQAHEQIHKVQELHASQLQRLRLVLLLAAALSGLLSAALILRSLRLWRAERQILDGQRELLSLASHELRRPLQSLLLATDLLRLAETPEDRLRYLSVVETSASQLASRADLEQLDAMYQQVHLDLQPLDLGPLLLQFHGERTRVEGPAELLAEERTVLADPARLRQIIENLHENALRYSSGAVVLRLKVHGRQLEVQVQDSGSGIDPADVQRLYLPGERGPGQARHPGQGLGLTIASRLAQAHGAALTLHAAPGGGTLATLHLSRERTAALPRRP